jgi:hypothetical protein
MKYKYIYDSIIRCKGNIITFIHDIKSKQLINFILEDLKNDYKIVNFSDIESDFLIEDNYIYTEK